jgi:tol-pal system protein YbgF
MKLILSILLIFFLAGCAAQEELVQTQKIVASLRVELENQKDELQRKISALEGAVKEQQENLIREKKERDRDSRQILEILNSVDNLNEKIKTLTGKLDELEHQIMTYWKETREELANIKSGAIKQIPQSKKEEKSFEELYREAFELYQKANYEESARKFREFLKDHASTPLAPNAYYWLGESFMALKDYEKAILTFQEIIEKYSRSEFAPKAYLSQAEAFSLLGDKKSASTTLKRVIELFPKSEEARIAERRLRNLLSE